MKNIMREIKKECACFWKRRRELWKKYQVVVWIEVIFICVMLACTIGFYRMALPRWNDALQNKADEFSDYMKEIETDDDIYNLAFLKVMEMFSDSTGTLCNRNYAVSLQFYSNYNPENVTEEMPDQMSGVIWTSQKDGAAVKEYFVLEDYFSEEQLADFYNNFYSRGTYQAGTLGYRTNLEITEITGFYESSGEFSLTEVTFQDPDDANGSYVLKRSGYNNRSDEVDRICSREGVSAFSEDNADSGETLELGFTQLYVYDAKFDLSSLADEALLSKKNSGNQASVSGLLHKAHCGSYALGIAADTGYLAKQSGILKKYVPPMIALCQTLAVFLIAVYLYMKKKEDRLQNMRNTFINAIAHEMKTPASVIQNSTECLQEGIHPEKQQHYAEMIRQEAGHMNDLLNSMLVYTRVLDSVYEPVRENCELSALAETVSARYREAMEKRSISLVWEKKETEAVSCDKTLMEMALDNFFSNAVKFCNENGTVRVTAERKSIRIYNEGRQLEDDEKEHIWEPLYQSDEARSEYAESSGMGLAIVAAILKLHRADYGVENADGGVEFFVTMR